MATKPRRYRWECPNGRHPGVLAPGRLRKVDVRRYCLRCSEAQGILVERVCPPLDKRRAKRKVNNQARQAAQERARQRRETVRHRVGHLDLRREVRRVEALPVVAIAYQNLERRPVQLTVRRSRKAYATGRAWCHSCRVVLTVPRKASVAQAAVLIAHEIAHIATADSERHGAAWRTMFLAILRDGYGLEAEWPFDAETGRSVSHNTAHSAFVKLLEDRRR